MTSNKVLAGYGSSEFRQVIDALRTVEDPELGADIVSLGLVYNLTETDGTFIVTMTLTYPGCPLSEYFVERVEQSLRPVITHQAIQVRFSFDPPWQSEMMDPDLRAAYALG